MLKLCLIKLSCGTYPTKMDGFEIWCSAVGLENLTKNITIILCSLKTDEIILLENC